MHKRASKRHSKHRKKSTNNDSYYGDKNQLSPAPTIGNNPSDSTLPKRRLPTRKRSSARNESSGLRRRTKKTNEGSSHNYSGSSQSRSHNRSDYNLATLLKQMRDTQDFKKIPIFQRIGEKYYTNIAKKLTRTTHIKIDEPIEFDNDMALIDGNQEILAKERLETLDIIEKTGLEKLRTYHDKYPLLKQRKALLKLPR